LRFDGRDPPTALHATDHDATGGEFTSHEKSCLAKERLHIN
jgi:hypothetical protein